MPMSPSTRARARTALVVLAFVSAGCSTSDGDDSGTAPRDDPDAAFWSECPDTPVYDRNLDFVTDPGLASPRAAVLSVAPAETSIERVTMDDAAETAEVDVSLGDDNGVFHVEKRPSGWVVRGAEGCAAWPAGLAVMGPLPDCDTEAYCTEQYVSE